MSRGSKRNMHGVWPLREKGVSGVGVGMVPACRVLIDLDEVGVTFQVSTYLEVTTKDIKLH